MRMRTALPFTSRFRSTEAMMRRMLFFYLLPDGDDLICDLPPRMDKGDVADFFGLLGTIDGIGQPEYLFGDLFFIQGVDKDSRVFDPIRDARLARQDKGDAGRHRVIDHV